MANVIRPDAWWSGRQPPPQGPTEPPSMDIAARVTKIETILPTLATKEDLARLEGGFHKEMTSQTWRIISWVTGLFVTIGGSLVAVTYFIAKHT